MIHESYLGMTDDDIDAIDSISDCMSTADLFLADPIGRKHATAAMEVPMKCDCHVQACKPLCPPLQDAFNVYSTSVIGRGVCLYKQRKGAGQNRDWAGLRKPIVSQVRST